MQTLRSLMSLIFSAQIAITIGLLQVNTAGAQIQAVGRAHIDPLPDYFRLQMKHGGKYLDADHCTEQVHMNPNSDWERGACQLWHQVPAGDGWFRLQLKHGGQYLDADHCTREVHLNPKSDWENGACQLWRLVPAGDGWFRLQLKHGGQYLDGEYCTDKVSMNPGSDWENGACQLWRLVADPKVSPPQPAKPAIDKETQWRCDRYAKVSIEQFKDNVTMKCKLGGARWQDNYNNHFQWCVQAPENQVYAETKARREELERCQRSKGVRID